MLGHRGDLAVGQAGGDYHAVTKRRLAGEIERDDVFRLVFVEAADDQRLQMVERRLGRRRFAAGRGRARARGDRLLARRARRLVRGRDFCGGFRGGFPPGRRLA
jgi:hypothetical protein